MHKGKYSVYSKIAFIFSIVAELRDLIFGYVIAVSMTVMSINFLRNQQVLLKVQSNSFNIAPIELNLVLWLKSGKVNIPTKFQKI